MYLILCNNIFFHITLQPYLLGDMHEIVFLEKTCVVTRLTNLNAYLVQGDYTMEQVRCRTCGRSLQSITLYHDNSATLISTQASRCLEYMYDG